MHNVDDVLRRRFEAMGGIVPVDSDRMLRRVAAVRRRRAVVTSMAAAALVLTTGAAGTIVLRGGSGAEPSIATGSGTPGPDEEVHVFVAGAAFAGAHEGYVLTETCGNTSKKCARKLAATADGGKTWKSRTIPASAVIDEPSEYVIPQMAVPGPNTVIVYSPTRDRQWLSRDGGRTWGAAKRPPTNQVDRVPDGGDPIVVRSNWLEAYDFTTEVAGCSVAAWTPMSCRRTTTLLPG